MRNPSDNFLNKDTLPTDGQQLLHHKSSFLFKTDGFTCQKYYPQLYGIITNTRTKRFEDKLNKSDKNLIIFKNM